jgi:phosphate transport system protein
MAAVVDTRIEDLKAHVLEMMGMAMDSLEKAVRSLDDRDADLAGEVIERDRLINELEARIDRECLELLSKGKLEGKWFRTAAATFKLVTDVERIGDYCVAIAEVAQAIANKPLNTTTLSMTQMANIALRMLDACIAGYEAESIDPDAVIREDGAIDRIYEEVFAGAISSALREPKSVTLNMYTTVASRALERIGDHSTNIAEDISFIDSGELARRDEAVYVPAFP